MRREVESGRAQQIEGKIAEERRGEDGSEGRWFCH